MELLDGDRRLTHHSQQTDEALRDEDVSVLVEQVEEDGDCAELGPDPLHRPEPGDVVDGPPEHQVESVEKSLLVEPRHGVEGVGEDIIQSAPVPHVDAVIHFDESRFIGTEDQGGGVEEVFEESSDRCRQTLIARHEYLSGGITGW